MFTPPEGFKPYCKDDTFNDVVAPLFLQLKQTEQGLLPVLGLHVQKSHCNYVGMAHGGALMTFMDIAMSGAVSNAIGKYTSTPTINLNFNFVAAANEGEFIIAEIQSIDMTRTMGFVNAAIMGPQGKVAQVTGTFKLPQDINKYPGMSADEYHAWRTAE